MSKPRRKPIRQSPNPDRLQADPSLAQDLHAVLESAITLSEDLRATNWLRALYECGEGPVSQEGVPQKPQRG